jgi:hypothetical protein
MVNFFTEKDIIEAKKNGNNVKLNVKNLQYF